MESTSLCSSSLPSSSIFNRSKPRIKGVSLASRKVYASAGPRSDAHDKNCPGGDPQHRLVDENMIVLRKRIHEMKMIERNYEPPENWMEWEKKYYTGYDSYICEAMGVLQAQLMNTRPSFALGVLALIALSVPTSAAVLCFRLMELTNGILAGIQHVA